MSATWTPEQGPMPALYIGHGAPPLLDDALWTSQLAAWARALPRPRAILAVSAHWESAPVALSASAAGTPVRLSVASGEFRSSAMKRAQTSKSARSASAP